MNFIESNVRAIPSMQASLHEYVDPVSGARHLHLATEDAEMAFLVAFPTVPDKSDGRAHILEHLALCGSDRYPVRDPFFSMLRRSTATFMNAMTSPDRTVYPFASADQTDFFNLLGVYLDAAFFPKLDYLDFLQEGWRYTLENGKLGYGGVVFNEMKGAFADPTRELGQSINAILFKGTTYEVEYGGDPLDIPSLTHADLKAFHASHYHPSQAVFMTSGRVDPLAVQRVIAEQVLAKFDTVATRRTPGLAPAWTEPRSTVIGIPSAAAAADEHGVQIAWLMGEAADPVAYCNAYLLESGLVGDSSAPVMQAMEAAGHGRPSAFNGLDPHLRQMVFHLGMEGLTKTQVAPARKRIWNALEKTAEKGVPLAAQQATLRDLRFSQRQINGGRTPYGLRKLLEVVPLAMAGADAMVALDNEATFAQLDAQIRDPAFFKSLARTLLAAPTRLDIKVTPDARYFEARQATETAVLAARQASLSASELARIEADATALLVRQRLPADNSVLPRIRPQDVSAAPRPAFALPAPAANVVGLDIASNGVSYASVIYDVSSLAEAEWQWLDLYSTLLSDLGMGSKSFEDAAAWRQEQVPRFDVDFDAYERMPEPGQAPALKLQMIFSARNLREETAAIAAVLSESIRGARFDERERIAFLIDSVAETLVQELGENGDRYAAIAADAPFSARGRFDEQVEGTAILRFYRTLARQIETEDGMEAIVAHLDALHRQVTACAVTIIGAGVGADGQRLADLIDVPGLHAGVIADAAPPTTIPAAAPAFTPANLALVAPAQVNHCFASWPVPYLGHPDCPVLSVLANLLTNQILHQALREEGGAYGGRARNAPQSGIFTMLSYRDPRLAETYRDFGRAIAWVIESPLLREHVEEAIIGVVSDLDKPQSPHEEALHAWRMQERGITHAMRVAFRTGVLECSEAQLKTVAARYLLGKTPSRAAFASDATLDLAGLASVDLHALAA
ncbi:MAG: insulinase family protein [Herminiimonas sp.]|nr:insulinase family protein [Herminiimonas sp.]